MLLNKDGLPYKASNEIVVHKKSFSKRNTVFFVLDPWDNMPSDFLNKYHGKITSNYILPLITEAAKKGFPVYMFTNDCSYVKPKPYSCAISAELLGINYPTIYTIFWQNLNTTELIISLKDKGISNLIYVGFNSNACIIARPIGMIPMAQQGFSLYFIPEASAAIETEDSWQSQQIHKATTITISQWIGELIKYDDIYLTLKKPLR